MSIAMVWSTSPSVTSAAGGARSGSKASADVGKPCGESASICKEAGLNQQNEAERNYRDDERVFNDLCAVFFNRQTAEEIAKGFHIFTYKNG
ncbi:hypothetical protein LJR178_008163 [Variovorax sp. LjRoot178]